MKKIWLKIKQFFNIGFEMDILELKRSASCLKSEKEKNMYYNFLDKAPRNRDSITWWRGQINEALMRDALRELQQRNV